MGKAKKLKLQRAAIKPNARKTNANAKPKPADPSPKAKQNSHSIPPTIPFDPEDRILLIGEGDFSFAHSLLTHHGCTNLLATSYDSHSLLLSKYPQAGAHVRDLEAEGQKVLYGVDATRLGKAGGGGKEVRSGPWDRIVFNFPHVGGLTKDVNRQVRHNQELLVGFFRSALPLLAPGGSIVITVFEGEPYELWNVRDLARHVGLKVGRSFRFQSAGYPGYQHARTLGNIEGGGGWKGENRAARTYVFENVGEDVQQRVGKKRKRMESDDEEEED